MTSVTCGNSHLWSHTPTFNYIILVHINTAISHDLHIFFQLHLLISLYTTFGTNPLCPPFSIPTPQPTTLNSPPPYHFSSSPTPHPHVRFPLLQSSASSIFFLPYNHIVPSTPCWVKFLQPTFFFLLLHTYHSSIVPKRWPHHYNNYTSHTLLQIFSITFSLQHDKCSSVHPHWMDFTYAHNR